MWPTQQSRCRMATMSADGLTIGLESLIIGKFLSRVWQLNCVREPGERGGGGWWVAYCVSTHPKFTRFQNNTTGPVCTTRMFIDGINRNPNALSTSIQIHMTLIVNCARPFINSPQPSGTLGDTLKHRSEVARQTISASPSSPLNEVGGSKM